jgi:hypothetical protein
MLMSEDVYDVAKRHCIIELCAERCFICKSR